MSFSKSNKKLVKTFLIVATTQLNSTQSWVGLIFLRNHTTNRKTVRYFISAPTQPNPTKFSMQPYFNPTRRFMGEKNLINPKKREKTKTIFFNQKQK